MRYRQTLLCVLGVLLTSVSVLGAADAPPLTLVDKRQAKAIIVTASPSDQQDQRLVDVSRDLLVTFLERISGVELEVVSETALGNARIENGLIAPEADRVPAGIDTFILIGEGELARALGVTNDQVGRGGIRIKTTGNAIVITGPYDGTAYRGGTVYATYRFLEQLGVRYLWPGELGMVVPEFDTVRVDALDIAYAPPIGQRHIRFMPRGPRRHAEGLELLGFTEEDYERQREAVRTTVLDSLTRQGWGTWHGLGGSLGIRGGHAGKGLREAQRHMEENPDWFALQADGTRNQRGQSRWRLCVSNMDLIEHVAADVIERVRDEPQHSVSLSPNDGGYVSFCMCENCKALDPSDAPKVNVLIFEQAGSSRRETIEYPSLSDRYIWYWNQIAERVTRVHPDLLLVVDAYSAYATPPVREQVHPNLVIRYVPSHTEGWTGWQEAGARRIFWRPNSLHSGYVEGTLNRYFARDLAETMTYFAEHGTLATDIQGIYDNWATMGLNYYVAARYNWDPFQDYDELLDDYARTGFGPAAELIKRYFRTIEDLGHSLTDDYTPEVITELRSHLEEAKQAASGDETIQERIAFLRVGLEFTALTAEANRKVQAIENEQRRVDKALGRQVLDRRWLLMRHIFEHHPMAVNVALVEGNNIAARRAWSRALDWPGPTETAKRLKADTSDEDAWLYEDQTVLPE